MAAVPHITGGAPHPTHTIIRVVVMQYRREMREPGRQTTPNNKESVMRWWEGTPKPNVWPVKGGRYNLYQLWMDGTGPRHTTIIGGGYETLEQALAQAAWYNEKWPQLDVQVLDHKTGEVFTETT